jgi:hypothetical protein
MIADRSIDLALSFDSLVHAEADVLSSYLAQLATKLRSDGVAFIHHSNFGECARSGVGNARMWRVSHSCTTGTSPGAEEWSLRHRCAGS